MTQTPIADWLKSLKNKNIQRRSRNNFEEFLTFWHAEGHKADNCPSNAWHVVGSPINSDFTGMEVAAQELLTQRFQDLSSPDQNVRFNIDNVATRWFDTVVAEGRIMRNTAETCLGNVMGFFRYHRCRIVPQVKFLRQRTRRKETPDLKGIQTVCSFMDLKYRLAVMIMSQTGARPDSILKLKVADFRPFKGQSEFYLLNFMESKRGYNWGYSGFVGPEVVGEIQNYLRSTGKAGQLEQKIFDYTTNTLSRAWTDAVEKAGLDQKMEMNGRTQHLMYLYTVKSFFKDVLDNSEMSKDWIDVLIGHKLAASDEAYTPAVKLFNYWRDKIYPQIAFGSSPVVAESIELKKRVEELEAGLQQARDTINLILSKGKTMLGLTEEELAKLGGNATQ